MTVGRVIDIANYQHPNGATITWAKVRKAGVTTVIVKATEGTTYVNPYFAGDVKGAKAAGLDTLAYHYASYTTVEAEAEHFIETVGNLTLPRMLDGEGDTTHVAWSNTFLGLIAPTPTERLYYGGSSALSQIGPQMRARLMVAAYPAHGAPTVGYPGYGVLWQYTDRASVPGISGSVDESKWYGTEAQYDTLFGIATIPAPPPLSEEELMGASIAIDNNGNAHIVAVGKGNGRTTHLLYLVPSAQAGGWNVDDVTAAVALANPTVPAFTVAP